MLMEFVFSFGVIQIVQQRYANDLIYFVDKIEKKQVQKKRLQESGLMGYN